MASRRPGLVAGSFTHVNADDGAFQRDEFNSEIEVVSAAADALFGALLGSLRAIDIDFVRTLRRFRQHTHLIGKNFSESPGHRYPIPAAFLVISQRADLQLRKQ